MFSNNKKLKIQSVIDASIIPKEDTLPKLLRKNFLIHPRKDAMRVKDRGIWITYSWKDYYEKVKYFCLGLTSLGLRPKSTVSIIGENKPEWYWAELAVLAARGIVTGIYVDCTSSEVKYFAEHSESIFVVAHDQEQVDKFLEVKEELPFLKKIIYWDQKGLWSYNYPVLITFEEVLELGREYEKEHPSLFEEMIDQGKGEDIAIISYTSGTTGKPKGAMLDNKFLVKGTFEWSQRDSWYGKGYEYVSFIPPAWGTEQVLGIAGSLIAGLVVNFPEKPETVQEDLREIAPHIILYGVRLLESINRMVQARMMDASFLRRQIYKKFISIGLKIADISMKGKKLNLYWKALYFIAYHAVFRQLRDRLGLPNIAVAYTGGAPLSPDIIRYFKALGIEFRIFYGSTEMGIVTLPVKGEIRPETSGKVLPWVQLKISGEGEILVKNEYMYAGYFKDSVTTQKKLKNGWYCSGDFGYVDGSGHLIVIDRMEDLKPLAGGKQFSPQYTEVRLRFSPFIKDILVLGGEDRAFPVAIINIDLENVSRFADANQINYTTFADLSQKPEVIDLVKQEIVNINRTLPEYARLKRFVNLHKEFDADEAELTRTRKLRRAYVEERYDDLKNALYGDKDEIAVKAPVTYRDGRTGMLSTVIKINSL